jgi:hypothetical protein
MPWQMCAKVQPERQAPYRNSRQYTPHSLLPVWRPAPRLWRTGKGVPVAPWTASATVALHC